MYDKFEKLLTERKITPYRVHKETGISTATLSDWKNGKSQPKKDKVEKLCKYFNVPLSYFYGTEKENRQELAFTPREEHDISKKLDETLNQLESSEGLMFDGEALDDETKELLKISLENAIRTAKVTAKRKFTPKKYQ